MRFLGFALLACSCTLSSTSFDADRSASAKDLADIAELEDRRSLGDGKLVLLALTANDPAVRARGLLALGRLQDVDTADAVVKGLSDPDAQARLEAAFAVGLFGLSWEPLPEPVKSKLGLALLAAEDEEEDAAVKLALLEAMGRVASVEAVERLVDRLAVPADVRAKAAVALGVAQKNGQAALPARAYDALLVLTRKETPTATRFGAAYALAMSKNPSARVGLAACVHDDVSEVRAVCARGLGDVGTDGEVGALKDLLDDPDYRVVVEATRSLARIAAKCKAVCPALSALDDLSFRVERLLKGDAVGGGQPLLALAQAGLPPAGLQVLTALRQQLVAGFDGIKSAPAKADAANIDCRLAAALDRVGGALAESLTCGHGLVPEAQRLRIALQELAHTPAADPAQRIAQVQSLVTHSNSSVRIAALDVLVETKSPLAIDLIRSQLGNTDPLVAISAAVAATKLKDQRSADAIVALGKSVRPDVAPPLAEALAALESPEARALLETWLHSPHLAVRQAAAEALTAATGHPVVPPKEEHAAPRRPKSTADGETKLHVRTAKGDFDITLDVKGAPVTTENLVTLAKRGYFQNLTFHRVVPNFVVQGGDPRGDGEGGPGYTQRCEINHHPYSRGAVGMALSGKDTGGSQFFVTTSAQPHLEGRYTVWGEVTMGLEVVDALLEGDRLIDVTAE